MKTEPLVSIITPCYNSEKFIDVTIQSILNQSYKNWELLITDDSSTDTSVAIINSYSKNDTRIHLFELDGNSGAAISRNKGIENAKGKYIAFLDSDDIWLPQKLERQINFMETHSYALTYTSYTRINEAGEKLNQDIHVFPKLSYKNMLTSNKMGCLTVVYNKEMLGKVLMPNIRKRQDYALWLKILKTEKFAYGLDEILALYRIRATSISSKKLEMLKWNWKLFREVEQLSFFQSLYCVSANVLNKSLNFIFK